MEIETGNLLLFESRFVWLPMEYDNNAEHSMVNAADLGRRRACRHV